MRLKLYAVKARLSRRPGHAAAAAALLLMLASLLGVCAALVWVEKHTIDEAHARATQAIRAAASEGTAMLAQLNRDFPARCDEEDLKRLRIRLFVAEHVGDVGVLDEAGRVACTATVGAQELPIDLPAPDVQVSIDGLVNQINFSLPAFGTNGRISTVAARAGRFLIFTHPVVLDSISTSGIDAARMVLPVGSHVVYAAGALDVQWRERLTAPEYLRPLRRFLWGEQTMVAVSKVEGTRYLVQSVRPLGRVLQAHLPELVLGVTLSLVLALLSYGAIKPVLQRWGELEHRIEGLVREDNIICMFQPIIELASSRVVGCEVLMRLRDGDKIIFPDQALPAIIRRRLTWQLDQAVLRASIRQLLDDLPEVQDFKVAFNLFPENVRFAEVQATIAEALDGRSHAGLRFDLEVIEQHYQASILDELAQFKVADFLVSVDDFGTGYSNLGTIKSLAPDFLKIDKSFVFDMEEATVRSSLIPEIIAIARAVGAQLVAEGIENETQLRLLHDLGVEYGQGYFFARPMSIEKLAEFVRDAGPRH